jgi:hypothetical protein
MDVLTFVLVIVFFAAVLGPIGKGIGARVAKGSISGSDAARLRAVLEQTELRLGETERRLGEMEERLDFYEKLLASSGRSPELPGG